MANRRLQEWSGVLALMAFVGAAWGDDPLPAFSVWDTTVAEGDEGVTNAVFVVTLSPPATNALYVTCAAGSATASTNDFEPRSTILTFEPGVTNAAFTVPVKGNTTYESNEFFRVHLTFYGSGAIVARSPATGTIVDDDAVPGRLDRFVVEPFTTPHYAKLPFPVVIRAVDFTGAPATTFQGTAALSCDTDYGSVTRFFDNFEDGDLSGWTNRGGGSILAQATTNTAAVGQRSLEVYGYGTGLYGFEHPFAYSTANRVSFFARASGANSGGELSLVTRAFGGYGPPFTFLFNNNGLMGLRDWRSQFFGVPYVVSNWYKITLELTWRGELNDTLDFYVNDSLVFTNISFRDRYSAPVDHVMVRAGTSTRVWFDEIRVDQTNLHLNVPMAPAQVQFADGVWQGELIASEYAPKAILRVNDRFEHVGQSEPWDVLRPLALTLTAPSDTSEGAVIVIAATIPLPLSRDHVVSLLSLHNTVIAVPSTIIIPAGSTNISFGAEVLDDADLDGTQIAEIVASSPYFTSATNRILVHDNEAARLTVRVPEPARVSESGGSIQGAVIVATPVAADVTVRLLANPTNQISLPTQVTILAGQTSAVFTASAINDRFIDGTVRVTLTATVEHWISGAAELEVLDNENTDLLLTTTGSVSEGQGLRTNFAAVRLSGQPLTNVVVELISSDTTELQVPASVTIPAGQTSLVFQVSLIDDSDYDGAQTVTLTARAAGFVEATRLVTVLDNEVHHIAFLPVSGVKTSGVPFAVTIQRRDINDQPLLEYGGPPILLSLTATNVDGNPLLVEPQQLSASGVGASVTIFAAPTIVRLHAAGEFFHAESNPFELTGLPLQTFNLTATDLAYDSVSGNIYAAVTNNNGLRTNQVVAIDTQTGRLGISTALPGVPNKLAVAASGEFLYVGFDDSNIVMRLDLPSLHTNLVFPLDTPASPLFVEHMLTLPSNPRAVVIARRKPWNTSPRHEGVAVYDDGIKRPVNTDDHIGSNAIDFGPTEDILYGTSLEASPSSFFRMRISPSGVVTEREIWGGVNSFYERGMDYDAGFVYAWLGNVIDPETARTVDHLYSSHVKADSSIDRITTLQASDNAQAIWLSFYEQHARVFLGGQVISNVYGITRSLIRWGANGVAFANTGGRFGFPNPVTVPARVFLLRCPWLLPGPAADLSIRLQADTALGLINQDVIYTATVSNAGPNAVSNVLVRHRLPWISLTASRPHSISSGNIQLPGLGVGETVALYFVCQTNKPFALSNVVWVGSAAADPNLNNNMAGVVTPVTFYTTPNQIVEWPGLRVKDIVWDSRGQKIYAITPPASGSGPDSLVAIDPARATVGTPYPLGTNAWRLEVSDLGEYLYLLQGTSTVRRFSLPALDSHFQFQSLEELMDFAIAPDNPTRVAIFGRYRIRIHDNGVALPLTHGNAALSDVTFGANASRLYALTPSSYLFKFDVTDSGVVLRDQGSLSLVQSWAFYGGGRIYLRDGSVYDAESRAKVGQLDLQTSVNYVLPDLPKGLVHSYSYPQVFIHDAARFNTRAIIQPLNSVSFADRIIRWGDDGLALQYNDRLTILRTSHIADLDRDGSSDTWERTYFGSTNSPAALPNNDADGDGSPNWKEFLADTDPTDPQSALRLKVALENGTVRLRFASADTRYYNIERTSHLSTNRWATLVRNIPGTGATIELTDQPSASEPVFYRLKVLD